MELDKINSAIKESLTRRGFSSIKSSNTRKIVLEFEKNENSISTFEMMYNKPILRVLIHLLRDDMLNGALTTQQAFNLIGRRSFKDALSESPIKNIYCKGCNEVIYSYRIYEERKPTGKITCPACHRVNTQDEWIEKDDWTWSLEDSKHYLEQLSESGFFSSKCLETCPSCMDSRTLDLLPPERIPSISKTDLQKYVLRFYCERCMGFYDITKAYFIQEDMRRLWIENGTWLEWYLKRIIKKHLPDANVEQGLLLQNDKISFQVDLILLEDEKLIFFQCKAKEPARKVSFNEVADVLKWLPFSDEIFLVTTGKVGKNVKKTLYDIAEKKLQIVESPDIEKIFLS